MDINFKQENDDPGEPGPDAVISQIPWDHLPLPAAAPSGPSFRKRYTRRSDVWAFMTHNPNSPHVICKICGLHLSASCRFSPGTSNLRNHLVSRHPDKYLSKNPDRAPRGNHMIVNHALNGTTSSSSRERREESATVTDPDPMPAVSTWAWTQAQLLQAVPTFSLASSLATGIPGPSAFAGSTINVNPTPTTETPAISPKNLTSKHPNQAVSRFSSLVSPSSSEIPGPLACGSTINVNATPTENTSTTPKDLASKSKNQTYLQMTTSATASKTGKIARKRTKPGTGINNSRHLSHTRPIKLPSAQPLEPSPRAKRNLNPLPCHDCATRTRARQSVKITNLIYKMIVEDLLPVSIVEGPGFQGLVDGLHKGYPFPKKLQLENRLRSRLKTGREKLGSRLAVDQQKVGLTCDLWTDHSNRSYITLAANIITKDWRYEGWILGTIEVNSSSSDEDVSHQIRALSQECSISDAAIVGIVYGTESKYQEADTTDRLEVLKNVCAHLNWDSRPCAGDLLEMSVRSALSIPPVSELIIAAKRLVVHLKIHKETCDKLLSAALQERKQTTILTRCYTSSRWQTVCDMFSELSELQEVIDNILEATQLHLTGTQWRFLHEILQALRSVKVAIAVMGDARNKSVSCWLPVVQGVLQNLEHAYLDEDISEDGELFISILKSELHAHCELNEILPSSLMMLASALDPRFHHLHFLSDEVRSAVIAELTYRLAEQSASVGTRTDDANKDSAFFTLLGEDEFNLKGSKPEDEIDLFRLERPVSRETDPLTWWHWNENRFPGLAKFAKAILCVPAAATPLTLTYEFKATMENRKRLESAKNVDAQLFLHKNVKLSE